MIGIFMEWSIVVDNDSGECIIVTILILLYAK